MSSHLSKLTHIIFISLIIGCLFIQPIRAQDQQDEITLDFYYESTCGDCQIKLDFIQSTYVNTTPYIDFLTVRILDMIENQTAREKWEEITTEYFGYLIYPIVVIQNDEYIAPPINEFDMTQQNIDSIIQTILDKNYSLDNTTTNTSGDIIPTPWGDINVSNLSIPVLTIILGGLDSFNPCAFFILLFLLNLLIYARSRKRMLLIGGIFIFFSGFLYMLFMFVMYEVLWSIKTTANIMIITMIVGLIVLPMGGLNIKDFFFFKKGASLSIPDDKKPKIYKQMRGLVKNESLSATIIGTVLLAASVNFYELLCTFGLPFAYINQLSQYSITETSLTYYFYILLYNIVYVIPLIIIVSVFVLTLGRRKLTEWHGQIMKLISGIMLSCFGIIFLVDYTILENWMTPIILLLFSLSATAIIAVLWKHFVGIPEENEE